MSFSRQHTFHNSTLCVSISQKPNSYRSTVKCIVKRKKSTFRSYPKLKIEFCPQSSPSGPFSQILSHIITENTSSVGLSNPVYQQEFQWRSECVHADKRCLINLLVTSTELCCQLSQWSQVQCCAVSCHSSHKYRVVLSVVTVGRGSASNDGQVRNYEQCDVYSLSHTHTTHTPHTHTPLSMVGL